MKILLRLNLAALLLLPAVVSAENWSSLEEDTAIYGRVVKVKNTTSTDTCKKLLINMEQLLLALTKKKANAMS